MKIKFKTFKDYNDPSILMTIDCSKIKSIHPVDFGTIYIELKNEDHYTANSIEFIE